MARRRLVRCILNCDVGGWGGMVEYMMGPVCGIGNLNVLYCRPGLVGNTSYIHSTGKCSLVFRE
jgi:hypothetical protein